MTNPTVHATPWYERAERVGLSLEWLAAMTGVSWSSAYAYKVGRRRTPPAWLEKVELLISARDNMPSPRDGV
jgi:hypothetical protein